MIQRILHCHIAIYMYRLSFVCPVLQAEFKGYFVDILPFIVIDVNDPLADKLNSMDDVDRWDSSFLYILQGGNSFIKC